MASQPESVALVLPLYVLYHYDAVWVAPEPERPEDGDTIRVTAESPGPYVLVRYAERVGKSH